MKKLLIICVTLIFISCAKEETLTEVSLDFNQFATTSNFPTILLYGVSASGSTFTRILDSGYFSSEIPSDVWNFHAIIWESTNGLFTGKSYCARALNVDLSSGEVDIDLSVSTDNCSLYSNHNGEFFVNPTIKVLDISNSSGCNISNESCLVTTFSSQYIVNESNNSNLLDTSISSACVSAGTTTDVNIIGEKRINHNLIGAFRVFPSSDNCDPATINETIVIGGSRMTTILDPTSGDVTIYLKI